MLDRLRTPLIPALVVAVFALTPARWLWWTNDAAAVLWLPLRPVAHLGAVTAEWLRPPAPVSVPDASAVAEERDELLALVQRLRLELERAKSMIEEIEGTSRPAGLAARPLAARVMTLEPDGLAMLDVGRRHGVVAGDPVVARGGVLVGRVGEPVDANSSVLIPAWHAGGAETRVRLESGGGGDAEAVLCLLVPIGDGWRGEVDALRIEVGASVRLDDASWPDVAQGLLLGRIAASVDVPERPLRAAISVTPSWSIGRQAVVVVQRSGEEAVP